MASTDGLECLPWSSDLLVFLAHLSRSDKVSFCDHILSVVCKQFLQRTSPSKLPVGLWPTFTGMILGWSSFKAVLFHCTSRSQELKIDFLTENLKKSSCLKRGSPGLWYLVCSFIQWTSTKVVQIIALGSKKASRQGPLFYIDPGGGWVRQRCRVSQVIALQLGKACYHCSREE